MTYEDLDVYQVSLDLAEMVYVVTKAFPKEELYGLTSQMRRSAISVPSNIAEGWGRGKGPANVQFVKVSRGSLYELRTQIEMSIRLKLVPVDAKEELCSLVDRVGRLIQAYLASIEPKTVREELAVYGAISELDRDTLLATRDSVITNPE